MLPKVILAALLAVPFVAGMAIPPDAPADAADIMVRDAAEADVAAVPAIDVDSGYDTFEAEDVDDDGKKKTPPTGKGKGKAKGRVRESSRARAREREKGRQRARERRRAKERLRERARGRRMTN